MNGVKIGKVGKLGNFRVDEEMLSQSEERLCQPIIKKPRETQSGKTRGVGRCGRKRTRRHML